jgi:hypothetical protein
VRDERRGKGRGSKGAEGRERREKASRRWQERVQERKREVWTSEGGGLKRNEEGGCG